MIVVEAKHRLTIALQDLEQYQNNLLASKFNDALSIQRSVEEESLAFSKNINRLNQRSCKWKSDQKRIQSALQVGTKQEYEKNLKHVVVGFKSF